MVNKFVNSIICSSTKKSSPQRLFANDDAKGINKNNLWQCKGVLHPPGKTVQKLRPEAGTAIKF